jgi:Domain of unknown function (DUF1730)
MESNSTNTNFADLTRNIKTWSRELGFDEIGISDTDLSVEENHLQQWLHEGRHGEMDYMARHGKKRARPHELVPGTVRVISVRLNYVAPNAKESWSVIADKDAAFISRYTLGRDYHKVMRNKLQKLADKIHAEVKDFSYRVFTDSAPVMEVALARKARQAYAVAYTRGGLDVFFGRAVYQSSAGARSAHQRTLRHLQQVHRHLPHTSDHGTLSTRCATLHFVSHD